MLGIDSSRPQEFGGRSGGRYGAHRQFDRLRLSATSAVDSRRDTIVVASVSCIFGLGSPDEYKASVINLHLPELFCGVDRRVGQGPTLYPVACSPQAWAAGAVFMLLQACLGITTCESSFRTAGLDERFDRLLSKG